MTRLTSGAVPIRADETPVLNHLDLLCRVLFDGGSTGGSFALIKERGAHGCMTPRHIHEHEAETFIVLDGALEGWCEGDLRLVEAGDLIHLPAGKEHAYRVSSSTAHFYNLITPAGFERFFHESGAPVDQAFSGPLPTPGPMPPEAAARLQKVLTPLGCTITGPPPFAAE